MLNNETIESFPPQHRPHFSGFSTNPIPHSAHRGTNSLLVPLKTKIPSPKVIQKSLPRHYCKCKVAKNHNLNSGGGGGEESHDECLDSFLFSELWPLSDTLGHVQGCQHLLKDGSFHVGSSQICFLEVTT